MYKVCKFGGSSLATAEEWKKVKDIVDHDDDLHILVVSAIGKADKKDNKVTDLLYLIYQHHKYHVDYMPLFEQVEAKYLAMGTHEVSYKEFPAMMSFKKYEIFYPSDMADMDSPLPAVIFVNGTGIKGTKYQALQKHASVYKAAVALSSTQTDMARALQWDSDPSQIKTPFLMISSTGSTDEQITPLSAMQANFDSIPDSVTKVLARRNTGDHGEMLYSGDGYVTAWFAYYLQGDEEAGKAFFGSSPEISANELYQDVEINEGE